MTAVLEPVADAPAPTAPAGGGRRRRRARSLPGLGRGSGATLGVLMLWLTLIVLLPLAAVVAKAFGSGWGSFVDAITNREAASALELTLGLALVTALVNGVMGSLVAWVLVRERFRGAGLVELVIDIPFALPTIVAGLVLLAVYGPNSPFGVNIQGTRTIMFIALLFVTLPFTVRTVQPVLHDLDIAAEQAASSLGASGFTVFRRIVLPQMLPAVVSGVGLSFARAVGEYGSLVLISSSIPFHTEIVPVQIYGDLQSVGPGYDQKAAALATILLLVSALALVGLELLQRRMARRG
ncbi:sulfate ABC transporter permease subunit CysT [Jatrophihabitans endophyticus]|uniref:sulfate ABC transporter permease subunit CysT n=1 Tax=Jatrophihabitans endophyticus TaxID=1206085 RepID=UPI0019FBF1D2|nr:sulfate ABC transporter permease subunit CysT [Jatrophihabitans endophyticus]MBE7187510.1 sulfate ABC transporter permease subunit CysT [Jatrophihabitans endophyticus]